MKALLALLGLTVAIALAPSATADQGAGNNGSGVNPDVDISMGGNGILFLCPGVGKGTQILGGGGGYCDFDFVPVRLGGGHIHCEWGGFVPVAAGWNCWRVFRGQPDHPALLDPDIIPDGWGVPNALTGPSPEDQWPPAGLAPAQSFLAPAGPPPGPPPAVSVGEPSGSSEPGGFELPPGPVAVSPPGVPLGQIPPFTNTPGLGP